MILMARVDGVINREHYKGWIVVGKYFYPADVISAYSGYWFRNKQIKEFKEFEPKDAPLDIMADDRYHCKCGKPLVYSSTKTSVGSSWKLVYTCPYCNAKELKDE